MWGKCKFLHAFCDRIIFFNDHPLLGKKELDVNAFDLPAMKKLYIEDPVFIYDPDDDSNRPVAKVHKNVSKLWGIYPKSFQQLFIKAFTEGLENRTERIRENEWQESIVKLKDSNLNFSNCGIQNFYDFKEKQAASNGKYWNCGQKIKLKYIITFDNEEEEKIVLDEGTKLYHHHLQEKNMTFLKRLQK
ncbi:MAG: hypothetical protein ACQEP9_10180 [Bacillota bacterium]